MGQFDSAFDDLPVVFYLDDQPIRWLVPLAISRHGWWLGDLSSAAYGHLEDCGWMRMAASGPATVEQGRLCPEWSEALRLAARALAGAGEYSGPESSVERWAAWLVFEWSSLHGLARELARAGETATVR